MMRVFFTLLFVVISNIVPASSYWQSRQQSSVGCIVTNAPTGGLYDAATFVGWSGADATGAVNQGTAPDCTFTAPSMIEDSAESHHGFFHQYTASITARPYTFSFYAKQFVGLRYAAAEIAASNATDLVYYIVDLPACTTRLLKTEGTYVLATASGTATPAAGGWCQLSVTVTAYVDTSLYIASNLSSEAAGSTPEFYQGDGTSGILIWGADLR